MLDATGKITRLDLNDQAYEQLREWLVARRLRPNEKVSLHEVASAMGVSRSPVHHALTRLVSEGLVSVRPRRGYFVTPIGEKAVHDAYDVRLALEFLAAEQTVGRLTSEQLADFCSHLERTLPAPGATPREMDIRIWHVANRDLHAYQVGLAGNPLLAETHRRLSTNILMERVLAGRQQEPWLDAVTQEHIELVAAFESGRLRRTKAAIRAHIETGRKLALDAVDRAGGEL